MLVALGILVLLCSVREAKTFRVARLETGDVFDNLEAGEEEFCEAVEAECVPLNTLGALNGSSLVIGDCSETADLESNMRTDCPACKCKNRGRFDAEEVSCSEPELEIGEY